MRRTDILDLLPGVFQSGVPDDGPLMALLAVMEDLHAPVEDVLAALDTFFDPFACPEAFLPYLATWVDLGWLLPHGPEATTGWFPSGSGQLRELIAASAELSRWRGSAMGLALFLGVATGVTGFRVEDDLEDRPFHIRVHVPAEAGPVRSLVERIVAVQKPAHATAELVGDDEQSSSVPDIAITDTDHKPTFTEHPVPPPYQPPTPSNPEETRS